MLQRGFIVKNDNHWDVCSTGLVESEYGPTVIIPLTQLNGMSDEEIGRTVRALELEAHKCDALELADLIGHDGYGYARNVTVPDVMRWLGILEPFAEDPEIAETIAFLKGDREPPQKEPRPKTKRSTAGYVYLIRCGEHYKIGITKTVSRRLTQFSTKLPVKPELVCSIPSPDMYTLEKELHNRFADKRSNGEWFALDDNDVAYISGMEARCD